MSKKVVGFQHWLNGRPDGYGSVERLFGVPSMSVNECENEGMREDAGMTYVYEQQKAEESGGTSANKCSPK